MLQVADLCSYATHRIEKVFKYTKDFEHNNYAHVTNAHQIITLAAFAYLEQDVTAPPPGLLSANINVYLAQVNHASGRVLVGYLKHRGIPLLQWQRSARECNAAKYVQLLAYSYHLYRSVAHKPVAQRIVLIGLLGFCCSIAPVQAALAATFAVTLLGENFMYIDRLVEYLNHLQQGAKRSAHAASFGRAMDMTTLLPALLHVRHAFQNHELGIQEGASTITTNQLVAARKLQNHFFKMMGSDLTTHTTHNQHWHTGIPVPLDAGDFRFRRPEEFVWSVARGASAGIGPRSRRETWQDNTLRFVYEHFFPY